MQAQKTNPRAPGGDGLKAFVSRPLWTATGQQEAGLSHRTTLKCDLISLTLGGNKTLSLRICL